MERGVETEYQDYPGAGANHNPDVKTPRRGCDSVDWIINSTHIYVDKALNKSFDLG